MPNVFPSPQTFVTYFIYLCKHFPLFSKASSPRQLNSLCSVLHFSLEPSPAVFSLCFSVTSHHLEASSPPTLTSNSKFMSPCHCGEPLGEKDKAELEPRLGDFHRNTDSLLLAVHSRLLEFIFWQWTIKHPIFKSL